MNTDNLKIKRLQQYLDKERSIVKGDINGYNRQLENNYLHFFDWHADDLYKAYYMDKNYEAVQQMIDTTESPKDMEAYLKRCILYVEDDLLNGPLVERSTNPMSNMAHSLEMECKQKLLKDFRNLNRILQSETISERISTQEVPKQEAATKKEEKKKTGPRLR